MQEMTKHFGALGFLAYGPRTTDTDDGETATATGSRANLNEVRRRALRTSGLGRAAIVAAGGSDRLIASALALSSAGARGASDLVVSATGTCVGATGTRGGPFTGFAGGGANY